MRTVRFACAAAALLVLAGCTTLAPRAPQAVVTTDAAQAAQRTREAWLAARPDWSLEGRVAIRKAGKGGSGRIDWTRAGGSTTVALSAPVTRQSWRLVFDARSATLEGLDGGPRSGADAEAVLREATGWDIPVDALGAWAQGRAAPGPAELAFDAAGQPTTLVQAGWTIRWSDWRAAADGRPALPGRIDAERDDARVRLLVDGWHFDGAP